MRRARRRRSANPIRGPAGAETPERRETHETRRARRQATLRPKPLDRWGDFAYKRRS